MSNIDKLHAQCDKLGLTYHHRASEDKLRSMIGAYLVDNPAKAGLLLDEGILESGPSAPVKKQWPIDKDAKPMTPAEYKDFLGPATRKSCGALKRIQVTCMNPMKKEWAGEILSVGSAKLGTFKKYVPFNNTPYHVPKIIYDMMKERKCTQFYTVKQKDGRGGDIRKGKLIPEFNIIDLPPLTPKELEHLANQQALAAAGL